MKKHSFGRTVAISLAAVGLSILSPFMLLSMSRVLLQSVVLVLLVGWGGIVPGILFSLGIGTGAALLGTGYGTTGPIVTGVFAAMMLVPAWVSVVVGYGKQPYFKGLRIAVAAQCAVTALGVALLYCTSGVNVADMVTSMLRAFYESQPPYVNEMTVSLLQQLGFNVTQDNISVFLDAISSAMQVALPVMLLTVSASTPLLTFGFARGMNPDEQAQHVPLCEWRVPHSMVLGVIGMFIACLLLSAIGMPAASTAVSPIFSLGVLMFAVQGASALDRAFARNPAMTDTRRKVMLVLAIVFCYDLLLPIVGVLSAFMGSQGIITNFLKKRNDKFNQGE